MAHLTEAQLLKRLDQASKLVEPGARYVHYKDPNHCYFVRGLAIVEETNEITVVYQAQYGAELTFTRPVKVWCQKVKWQGKSVPRFSKVDG